MHMLTPWAAVLAAALLVQEGVAAGADRIVSGAPPLVLDGDRWSVSRAGGVGESQPPLPARVPGDILTDLQRAGRLPDPYFNVSWRRPDFVDCWNTGLWTYTRTFSTPNAGTAQHLLVFDGIRMGAVVSLNGHWLFNASNSFLRYSLPLTAGNFKQDGSANVLNVTFGAELGIDCGGRFTLSSQIDWAPRMTTNDSFTGRSTFGFGIWRSVYLVPVPDAAITQLVVHTYYAGDHPTVPLSKTMHAGFRVVVRAEVFSAAAAVAKLTVAGDWAHAVPVVALVNMQAGHNNVTVELLPEQTRNVQLWDPVGYGVQHRYRITGTLVPGRTGAPNVTATRKIGFRHLVLVTINDTDSEAAASAANADGTGQFTMFFRCNGAAIYSRGANKIPMELMEGRMSGDAHRRLVQSAAEGRMNTLRVWGGAIWEPESFYDAADEYGILIYHDAQFLIGGLEPYGIAGPGVRGTASERDELEYQIKRLSVRLTAASIP